MGTAAAPRLRAAHVRGPTFPSSVSSLLASPSLHDDAPTNRRQASLRKKTVVNPAVDGKRVRCALQESAYLRERAPAGVQKRRAQHQREIALWQEHIRRDEQERVKLEWFADEIACRDPSDWLTNRKLAAQAQRKALAAQVAAYKLKLVGKLKLVDGTLKKIRGSHAAAGWQAAQHEAASTEKNGERRTEKDSAEERQLPGPASEASQIPIDSESDSEQCDNLRQVFFRTERGETVCGMADRLLVHFLRRRKHGQYQCTVRSATAAVKHLGRLRSRKRLPLRSSQDAHSLTAVHNFKDDRKPKLCCICQKGEEMHPLVSVAQLYIYDSTSWLTLAL